VGEEVKPQVVCTTCSKETVIKIKLDEITIKPTTKPVVDSNIKITDTLAIVMRYPSIHDIDYNKTEVEIAFDLAKRCIESVIIDEQVYQVKDINPQELTDFVDNMMPEQFAKIMDFIQSVPELSYEFQYQCPQCSETVKVQLKSVSDFFR
jgi:DNA-directed RNA polymerase subunit RPC12/RpoP